MSFIKIYMVRYTLVLLALFNNEANAQDSILPFNKFNEAEIEFSAGLYAPFTSSFGKGLRWKAYVFSLKRPLNENWSVGIGLVSRINGLSVGANGEQIIDRGYIVDFSVERAILQSKRLRFYGAAYLAYVHEYGGSRIPSGEFVVSNSGGFGLGLGLKINVWKSMFIGSEIAVVHRYGLWRVKDLSGCNCITHQGAFTGFVFNRYFSVLLGLRFSLTNGYLNT
jgi:hypothetical protein